MSLLFLCSISEGNTALNQALRYQSVAVVRRMEAAAPFAGFMAVKETKLGGLGSSWQSRWVTIVLSIPGDLAPAGQRAVRKQLFCYSSPETACPSLVVRSITIGRYALIVCTDTLKFELELCVNCHEVQLALSEQFSCAQVWLDGASARIVPPSKPRRPAMTQLVCATS